jgi:hypothetical protein
MSADSVDAVRNAALWFEVDVNGFGPLIDAIGDAQVVLIGEAKSASAAFHAVIHIDETRALDPLERWSRNELDLPETYPSAL